MATMLCAPIVAALTARSETVATAESLTGGLVATMITAVPGASAAFRGAVVAYATDTKASLLGVDGAQLEAHGAVHPETARAMAEGVRQRCGTTWGLATTGVAGPEPQEGKPVGLVYLALSGPEGVAGGGTFVATRQFSGSRKQIRAHAARAVLDLLAERLGIGDD